MIRRPVIDLFLNDKNIALAGVSRDPKKFGNVVYKTLLKKGYTTYPVNPNAETIEDKKSYKNLAELPEEVKSLLIVTNKKDTEKVMEAAVSKGVKNIWIQRGSETEKAIKIAKENHINLIWGICILLYTNPSGFHRFHECIAKLFGTYIK